MVSVGRHSELQALVFDPQYVQSKPKGAGVTLYFSLSSYGKNQRPNQVNDPWYIPALLTGKPDFGGPNCPVRALRYNHRYQTEHPELRKGRQRLFIPVKDNNVEKELWLLHYNFSTSRPTSSHENQEVVPWRHLHILLPLRPLSKS